MCQSHRRPIEPTEMLQITLHMVTGPLRYSTVEATCPPQPIHFPFPGWCSTFHHNSKNHEGTCYLGVYITADQNMQPMENNLWKKVLTYTTAFHQTPCHDKKQGSFIDPAFSHLLHICYYPQHGYQMPSLKKYTNCWHPQSWTKWFHRNLPHSMVFAPHLMGGVGLCNLQSKMETQQILILFCHMHAQANYPQSSCLLKSLYDNNNNGQAYNTQFLKTPDHAHGFWIQCTLRTYNIKMT